MVAINNQAKQTKLGKYFPTTSFSSQWLAAGCCHLELSLGVLVEGSSDYGGVVDHVLAHELLDGDLGHGTCWTVGWTLLPTCWTKGAKGFLSSPE